MCLVWGGMSQTGRQKGKVAFRLNPQLSNPWGLPGNYLAFPAPPRDVPPQTGPQVDNQRELTIPRQGCSFDDQLSRICQHVAGPSHLAKKDMTRQTDRTECDEEDGKHGSFLGVRGGGGGGWGHVLTGGQRGKAAWDAWKLPGGCLAYLAPPQGVPPPPPPPTPGTAPPAREISPLPCSFDNCLSRTFQHVWDLEIWKSGNHQTGQIS